MLIEDVGWKVDRLRVHREHNSLGQANGNKGGGGSEGILVPLVAVCPARGLGRSYIATA